MPATGGTRPKGLHIKHLTEMERFRVRTLYYDAGMSKPRIKQVTGYSTSQIRTAIHAQTAAVAPRSGRPKRGQDGQTPTKKQVDNAGPSSQSSAGGGSTAAQENNTNNTPVAHPLLDISMQALQEASQQQLSPLFTASPSSPSPSADPPTSSS